MTLYDYLITENFMTVPIIGPCSYRFHKELAADACKEASVELLQIPSERQVFEVRMIRPISSPICLVHALDYWRSCSILHFSRVELASRRIRAIYANAFESEKASALILTTYDRLN
jgi:hypothetical protein